MHSEKASRVTGNLRAELARRGIKQAQVAEILGLSQTAVSNRMIGAVAFSIDELLTISEHFGIDMADIIPASTDTPRRVA